MAGRVSSKRLVGRGRELGRLEDACDAAFSGAPSVFLVGGEAGVGKSRLVRELEDAVGARGVLVLHGDCIDLVGDELPYAPLVAALGRAVDDVEAAMQDMSPAAGAQLERLLPFRAPTATVGDGDTRPQSDLFELVLGLLRRLSGPAGLLLVVEDLHWADSSTRGFLSYVSRNLRSERIAVVATWRTDEPDDGAPHDRRGPSVADAIAELQRLDRVECMVLDRLSRDDLAEQVAEILGHPAEPELTDALFARSEGNPFYAEELLAIGPGRPGVVPAHLRSLLLVRLGQLPESVQELVRALAAFGRPASQEVLGAVTGVAEPRLSRELRKAVTLHVVCQAPEDRLTFRHALVREAVYEDLLPGERRGLHREIARALVRQPAPDAAELAHHWRLCGNVEAARAASLEAGLEAVGVRAFDEALALFERALELWPQAPVADRVMDCDRIDVLGHAAEAARFAGRPEAAVGFCREALALVDAVLEPIRAAWFQERLGRYCFWDFDVSVPAYSEALRLLPVEPRADRARLMGDQGLALMLQMRLEEAKARCEEAISVAQAAAAVVEEAYALTTLGLVVAYLGDTDAGEAHLRRGLRIAKQRDHAEDIARGYINLAEVLRLRGTFDAALEVTLEGEAEARRLGVEGSFGHSMAANACDDLYRLGRWQEVSARLGHLSGVPLSRVGALMRDAVAGHLAAARGDLDAACRHFDEAREQGDRGVPPEFLPTIGTGLATVALAANRPEDALAHVREALADLPSAEERLYSPMLFAMAARVHAELAEAARIAGSASATRHAEAAAALVVALSDRLVVASLGPPPAVAIAHLDHCRAEALRAAGTETADAWQVCVDRWGDLRFPYEEAYARFRLAEVAVQVRGRRRDAAAVLRLAARTARELGAQPLLREIEALARRARLGLDDAAKPTPQTRAPAAAGGPGLTPREEVVLELVAAGLTNRQIAERLFISQNTAGVHVSHILAKLNVDNRVAAAAVAHRAGLLGPVDRELLVGGAKIL